MKKTLLATAITALFAASAAHAGTVYEKNGTTVNVFGDIEVAFISTIDEDEDSYIELDDADIGVSLDYDLGNGFSAIATLSISGEGETLDLDDTFVGISSADFGTLTIGKQVTVYDSAGIGSDYQFGWSSFYEQDDAGDQVVKYSLDKGTFYGEVAWLENSAPANDNGASGVDAKLGVRVADFDFTLFYADSTTADLEDTNGNAITGTSTDIENINFEARYTLNELSLAVEVATSDNDDVTTDAVAFAATYQLNDKVQFAGGVANIDNDALDDAVIEYFINTSYAFNSHVNTYIEFGGSDGDDTELGYAAGMQVKF